MPTEAHVDAGVKTEVTPRIASDVEGVGRVERPLVAVRRREQHHDAGALRNLDPPDLS
jgi:hypothetical protein